jgi:hypothetical protein
VCSSNAIDRFDVVCSYSREASGSRNGDDIKFLCGKTRTEYKKETFERSAAEAANEQLRTEGTVVAGSSNTAVERSAAAGEDHDQDDKRK